MEHPYVFWLLFLLLPVTATIIIWQKRGRETIAKIAGTWQKDRMNNVFTSKVLFASICMFLFLITCVFSMSGIKWGKTLVKDDRFGLDLALVFDVSKSMLADDISPSRFSRAKQIAEYVVEHVEGSRISITAFRGKAVNLIPATEDIHALQRFLSDMNIDVVTSPGTSITDGLTVASQSFPEHVETHKCILLFSDGEYHDETPEAVTEQLSRQGIIVLPVGIATEEGSRIVLSSGDVVINRKGETVISKLNSSILKQIATATGGELFLASEGTVESDLLDYVKRYEKSVGEASFTVEKKNRYRFFLLIAFLFLAAYIVVGTVKWHDTL